MHPEHEIRLDNGLLQCPRVDHHEATDEDADFGYCAVCAAYVWMSLKAVRFANMRPDVPVLCCLCSNMSRAMIAAAVPDHNFLRAEIPDLARSGMFN